MRNKRQVLEPRLMYNNNASLSNNSLRNGSINSTNSLNKSRQVNSNVRKRMLVLKDVYSKKCRETVKLETTLNNMQQRLSELTKHSLLYETSPISKWGDDKNESNNTPDATILEQKLSLITTKTALYEKIVRRITEHIKIRNPEKSVIPKSEFMKQKNHTSQKNIRIKNRSVQLPNFISPNANDKNAAKPGAKPDKTLKKINVNSLYKMVSYEGSRVRENSSNTESISNLSKAHIKRQGNQSRRILRYSNSQKINNTTVDQIHAEQTLNNIDSNNPLYNGNKSNTRHIKRQSEGVPHALISSFKHRLTNSIEIQNNNLSIFYNQPQKQRENLKQVISAKENPDGEPKSSKSGDSDSDLEQSFKSKQKSQLKSAKISASRLSSYSQVSLKSTQRRSVLDGINLAIIEMGEKIKLPIVNGTRKSLAVQRKSIDIGDCNDFKNAKIVKDLVDNGYTVMNIRWFIEENLIKGLQFTFDNGVQNMKGELHGSIASNWIDIKINRDDELRSIYYSKDTDGIKGLKCFTEKHEVHYIGAPLDDLEEFSEILAIDLPRNLQLIQVMSYFDRNTGVLQKLFFGYS